MLHGRATSASCDGGPLHRPRGDQGSSRRSSTRPQKLVSQSPQWKCRAHPAARIQSNDGSCLRRHPSCIGWKKMARRPPLQCRCEHRRCHPATPSLIMSNEATRGAANSVSTWGETSEADSPRSYSWQSRNHSSVQKRIVLRTAPGVHSDGLRYRVSGHLELLS